MYYVIQVKTGQEEKTISAIKRAIGTEEGFDVFSPFRMSIRKYGNERRTVKERCFPGYLFVETSKPKELFFNLYWVEEFTKLLGREGLTYNFVPLSEDESRIIDILYSANNGRVTAISEIEVQEGQTIKVLTGPLEGLTASIKKVNLHKRYVVVGFPLCGQYVETKMSIDIIAATSDIG